MKPVLKLLFFKYLKYNKKFNLYYNLYYNLSIDSLYIGNIMKFYIKLFFVFFAFIFNANKVFAEEVSLDTDTKKQSYSMGTVIGKQIKSSINKDQFNINNKSFSSGVSDALDDKPLKLSNDEIQGHLLAFTKKQTDDFNTQVEKNAKNYIKELLDTKGIPELGNSKGKIVVVEFFDYNCAHCKLMSPFLKELVKSNKNVKLLLRNYPIMGENSNYAAKAVLWAMDNKKNSKLNNYINIHNTLLSNANHLKKQDIQDAVKKAGFDNNKFDSEHNALKFKKLIESNFKLASKLGIKGTPSLFIINSQNNKIKFLSGAVTNEKELQKIVDELK